MYYWTPKRLKELKEKGLKLTFENRTKKPKKLTTTIPPLRGPHPQGLNVPGKKTIVVSNSEKNNVRNRQVFTKRRAGNKIT